MCNEKIHERIIKKKRKIIIKTITGDNGLWWQEIIKINDIYLLIDCIKLVCILSFIFKGINLKKHY